MRAESLRAVGSEGGVFVGTAGDLLLVFDGEHVRRALLVDPMTAATMLVFPDRDDSSNGTGFAVAVGDAVLVDDRLAVPARADLYRAPTFALAASLIDPTPETRWGWPAADAGHMAVFDPADGLVYVFDLAAGVLARTLANPARPLRVLPGFVRVHPFVVHDGRLIAGTAGGFHVFDLERGTLAYTIDDPTPASGHFGRHVVGDGGVLWVADLGDGVVYAYDLASGAPLRAVADPGGDDPDFGRWIAVCGGDLLIGGTGRLHVVALASDSKTLLFRPCADVPPS